MSVANVTAKFLTSEYDLHFDTAKKMPDETTLFKKVSPITCHWHEPNG